MSTMKALAMRLISRAMIVPPAVTALWAGRIRELA